MPAQMTEGNALKWYRETKQKFEEKAERQRDRMAAMDARQKHLVLEVLSMVEIGAVAFGFGFARGYWGEKSLWEVPIELWTAAGAHIVGIILDFKAPAGNRGEWDRAVARQFHNLGNGALASYATTYGAAWGAEKRAQKGSSPTTSGALPGPSMHSLLPQGRMQEPYVVEPVTHAEMMQMATA